MASLSLTARPFLLVLLPICWENRVEDSRFKVPKRRQCSGVSTIRRRAGKDQAEDRRLKAEGFSLWPFSSRFTLHVLPCAFGLSPALFNTINPTNSANPEPLPITIEEADTHERMNVPSYLAPIQKKPPFTGRLFVSTGPFADDCGFYPLHLAGHAFVSSFLA